MYANETRIMKWLEDNGSSWMPLSKTKLTNISDDIKNGFLVLRKKGNDYFISLPEIKEMEHFIAKNICARIYNPMPVDHEQVSLLIEEFERLQSEKLNISFKYCDEQKEGIHTLVASRIAILTGGPGTGKTSVLQGVAYVLKNLSGRHITFPFTAPTGKAARRITEASGYAATTVQKYIGSCDGENVIIKCPDYIFCDEFSMADERALYAMLKSLMPNTSIFLIGDIDQLPSVGVGAVLRDIIDCKQIPYVQLLQTFRQDNNSVLFNNIQIVKTGGYLPLSDGSDFKNIRTEENILNNCINEYLDGVDKYGIDNTVILTAYRKKGTICSEKLNSKIQEVVNPESSEKPCLKTLVYREESRKLPITFRVDDPVMQLVNNDKVANGDIGKIIDIHDGRVTVEFSDCTITYYGKKLNELDLAYALSIHKSQGTEYKCVILPLLKENHNLDRNMIYTGISRAKKYCCVIGKDQVIQDACKIQSSWNRTTFLCEEIESYSRALQIRMQILASARKN